MKKFVIGIMVGAVLMFSGQALADSVSRIGKKVSAEYTVKVDGKALEVKAVNVGGTTMSPNRALAEAFGYDIELKNKVVEFTKKEVSSPVAEPEQTVAPAKDELTTINEQLAVLEKQLYKLIEESMSVQLSALNDPEGAAAKLKDIEARGKPIQAEIDTLKARKAVLEAQK